MCDYNFAWNNCQIFIVYWGTKDNLLIESVVNADKDHA